MTDSFTWDEDLRPGVDVVCDPSIDPLELTEAAADEDPPSYAEAIQGERSGARLIRMKKHAVDCAYTADFRDVLMIRDEWNAYEQSDDGHGGRDTECFPSNHGKYLDSGRLLAIRGTYPLQYAKIRKTRGAVNPGAEGELFLYVPLSIVRRSNIGTPIGEELEQNLQDCILLDKMEDPVTLPVKRGEAEICWITLEREIARDLILRHQSDPEGRGEFFPATLTPNSRIPLAALVPLSAAQKVAKLDAWPTDQTIRELTALYDIQ